MEKYSIVKFVDDKFSLDVTVSPKEETVWLSLDEMAVLFERDRSVIGKHIRQIYKSGELDEETTRAKNARVLLDGRVYNIDYYNLDVIISVGYRVNSKRGVCFRKWANEVLREYLINGYSINYDRISVSNDSYIQLKNEMAEVNIKIKAIEKKISADKEKNTLYAYGKYYDAYSQIQGIFESAQKEIIIIDNYVDRSVLDRLVIKKGNVSVKIYTNIKKSRIIDEDIKMFNKQYGNVQLMHTSKVHDRYIIIDEKMLYHIGHSIKDLGSKTFSISKCESSLIQELINNI